MVDTHNRKNVYGLPDISPNKTLENLMQTKMKNQIFSLIDVHRKLVEQAVEEFCQHKNYQLHAVNARTTHVHAVLSAQTKPEPIINFLKSCSTRKLRELKLISSATKPWSRGGSRRYLWKERHVSLAIEYVLYGQGDVPFEIDD